MKHFYLILCLLLMFSFCNAQNPFITSWEVTADDLSITIPTTGTGYNYTADFGDGTVQNNVTGSITHTYASPGIYTLSITGDFPKIHFMNNSYSSERNKILNVEQWGDIQWSSMAGAFFSCNNLEINATDAPDLSQVSDMSSMFQNATSFNQSINFWDVSNVNNMKSLFQGANSYNQPLDNWDVSSVTRMDSMFYTAVSFNHPLNNWNVSNVENMSTMFFGATSFNQPLNNWNVSNVTNMNFMFMNADIFDQSLNNWNVENVGTMRAMFANAGSFNQNLNDWDVGNVYDMHGMFARTDSFNQPLNNWNVENVGTMRAMFSNATVFNQPLNDWDVSSVNNMNSMFKDAISFNQPLSNWNVFNTYDMQSMFKNATSFNQDLSSWAFSNVMLAEFLDNCGMDVNNYDNLLTQLVDLDIINGDLGAVNLQYCNETSRNILIDNGWNITGDSLSNKCYMGVEYPTLNKVSIYPNPTHGEINIRKDDMSDIEEIKIYSIQGQEIMSFHQNLELLNVGNLSAGIYLMVIRSDKGSWNQRFIKQ